MKIKLTSFAVILFFLILILSGCTSYNILQKENLRKNYGATEKEPLIRLLIYKGENAYHITTKSHTIYVETLNTNIINREVLHTKDINIRIDGNKAIIRNESYLLPCKIKNNSGFNLNGHHLSGNLIFYKNFVVLEIPIEKYIEGVVASEVGNSWPIEALKAQAVVSRTYAVYNMLQNSSKPYDLGISEFHQKYNIGKDTDYVKKAVRSTRGIIIYYHSNPIQALYHSCSGGITEAGGNVFLKNLPYLKSIRDPYSINCPDMKWRVKLSSEDIINRLKGKIPENFKAEQILDIKIGGRTSSGRVRFFILIFKHQKFNIKGNDFRLAMGPKTFKSLLITKIIRKYNNSNVYEFFGKGYGHGVGMSQWGAKNMAQQGFSYINIIKFYYRGVTLGSYRVLPIFGRQ